MDSRAGYQPPCPFWPLLMEGGRLAESPVHTPGIIMSKARQTKALVTNIAARAPFTAHIYSAEKELVLGISSLLISHRPSVSLLCPQSLTSARGYWPAHRSMSRKLLKRRSAFPDFYFRCLFHPPRPTVPLLSSTSASTLSALQQSTYRDFQKREKVWRTLSFLQKLIKKFH